ncbi:carbohydrate kinase [Bacillus sp. ISL-40]|uniref:carbohydrate kinase family protein n=1 Tax=unclassified Bacillus (in: firmicutes) TaxID=185979 RepID=UPI001BED32B6|nr:MULTISPECIES: carbohydrate kinase [unclassified Bacillus (in: firmicutes)]MBT2697605.1 carbohydrate kinase [Bacillus sp. ISL-40]MBT2720844.1 carbohydrate kinase [Bacillus sp. ISL-46]MBT2742310.1 carbohydrate kinase [Bacillus sp. ISL-77]
MNKTSRSVMCVGELLIDFFCTDIDVNLKEGDHFLKKAGGAPANVAAAISKLGGVASLIGKVGNDPFGSFLKETLKEVGVDTSMVVTDDLASTTLAFVSLQADGERDFVFNRGADQHLTDENLNLDRLSRAKIIHFGSATALLDNPFKTTYFNAMEFAQNSGIFLSFDPNFRKDLWKNRMEEFISLARKGISMADFVKVSEEELELITGKMDKYEGIEKLHHLGAKIVAVTLGSEGTLLSNGNDVGVINSIEINSIDSTGAGDAFVGAALYQFANLESINTIINDFSKLKEIILFANKVGALVCTRVGAISSLPNEEDILKI